MLFVATVILAGGVLLFQYSRAADLGSRARTAGDAAALAAAGELADQFEGLLKLGVPPPLAVGLLDDSRDVAADYAARNDGVLTGYSQSGLAVRVDVATKARLDSRPIVDTGNRPGRSSAEAAVRLGVSCAVIPPRPGAGGPAPAPAPEPVRAPVAEASPVPPPPAGSVLRCNGRDVLTWDGTRLVDLRPFVPFEVRLID
jgi:hypothetical protein